MPENNEVKRSDKFVIPSGAPLYKIFITDYVFSENFAEVRAMFNKEQFTVINTGIPYRLINHWDKGGLLANSARDSEKGWRKFSIVEVAWIRIIKHLRNFGVSLEKIAKAKKGIMRRDGYFYRKFEFYLFVALFTNADPYVVILADGTGNLSSPAEIELFRAAQEHADMLLIPLRHILKEVGIDVPAVTVASFVDEKEQFLRQSLYEQGNKEIKIKLENGKGIREIETTKVEPRNPQLHKITKQIRASRIFGEVTTRFEEGRPQSVEIKERRRFEK